MSLNRKTSATEYEELACGNIDHSEIDAINGEITSVKQSLTTLSGTVNGIGTPIEINSFTANASKNGNCYYTQIGKVVNVTLNMKIGSTSRSAYATAFLTGLPARRNSNLVFGRSGTDGDLKKFWSSNGDLYAFDTVSDNEQFAVEFSYICN